MKINTTTIPPASVNLCLRTQARLTSGARGSFVVMTYSEKLRDPRWQKKRLEVMQRDKFTCRDCGASDKTLHVHHCFYEKGQPWETRSELMLTLCHECHEARGDIENEGKIALGFLFSKMVNAQDDHQLKEFVRELSEATCAESWPRVVDDLKLYSLWCRAEGLEGLKT